MRHHSYYDTRRGFYEDKPNWYLFELLSRYDDFIEFGDSCMLMIDWMYDNLDNVERHCRWYTSFDAFSVKFRYEKDYTWFQLVWG